MAMVLGGETANGTLTGDAWAWDGDKWASITLNGIVPSRGVAMFPYFTFQIDELSWAVTTNTALIAMGGADKEGQALRNVYVSHDYGVHWTVADTLMRMPGYMPAFSDAQAIVSNKRMQVQSRSTTWREFPAPRIPCWYAPLSHPSRAVKPEDEWECPFIYLFGGHGSDGQLHDTIWRGVINRLTFQPLY